MTNNLIKKLHNLFFDNNDNNNDDELLDLTLFDYIDKLDKSHEYTISKYEAFQIANQNGNLKTDFCKNTFENITYLYFSNCTVDLLKANDKKYWHVKITDGKMSWVTSEEDEADEFSNLTFCDGTFSKEDFEKLQCLIDVETGEYTYFPVNIKR